MTVPIPAIELPDVRWLGPRRFMVLAPFTWYDADDIEITVPAGFVCDGASVPRALWALLGPSDLSEAAWLLHDFLYWYLGTPPGIRPATAIYTRFGVDCLFDEINRRHGVVPWKRRAAYAAVRAFGWLAWR